jgi:hypothetical protein
MCFAPIPSMAPFLSRRINDTAAPHCVAGRGIRGGLCRRCRVTGQASQRVARLIVVFRADPTGRYEWLPPRRSTDVTVVVDEIATADLADRHPFRVERLQRWDERIACEHRIDELVGAVKAHPAVTGITHSDHLLIDFVGYRLRLEVSRLLRGWTLASEWPGSRELVCDPATPAALVMGARAGLELEPVASPYSVPTAPRGAHRALPRG